MRAQLLRNATMRRCALAGILLLFSTAAQAVLIVNAPWVRPTPDRASTDAYMSLTSTGGAVLKEVRSTIATSVVIRAAASGVKNLPQLSLPAGVPVLLSPDSVHLVLRGLAHPLGPGERVPLVLTIETADGSRQQFSVNAEVRTRAPTGDEQHSPKR
jgi:periplasmic copper chaperone A